MFSDNQMLDLAQRVRSLLDKAAHVRLLADQILDEQAAEALNGLAEDYEKQAAALGKDTQ
jgi:hypothetical protein